MDPVLPRGGAVEGSVRLQKLLFPLKRELSVDPCPTASSRLRGSYSEKCPTVCWSLGGSC